LNVTRSSLSASSFCHRAQGSRRWSGWLAQATGGFEGCLTAAKADGAAGSCWQPLKRVASVGLLLWSGQYQNQPLTEQDVGSETRRKMLAELSAKALPPERQAFSVGEVAVMLGVTPKSVYRLLQRGLLRSLKALRHHRIPRQEFERFLENL
jgi:excisionase family DNA binding protein